MKYLVYEKQIATRDALLHPNLDAWICVDKNPNELM